MDSLEKTLLKCLKEMKLFWVDVRHQCLLTFVLSVRKNIVRMGTLTHPCFLIISNNLFTVPVMSCHTKTTDANLLFSHYLTLTNLRLIGSNFSGCFLKALPLFLSAFLVDNFFAIDTLPYKNNSSKHYC